MRNKDNRREEAAELRQQAEEIARKKDGQPPENPEALSPEEMRQTLHELQVHQIELELQNEELRRAQLELDAAAARYFDLYDLAPVGYCTLSKYGLILEANLTAATLLGVSRSALGRQPISRFILKEDEDIYYLHRKKLVDTGTPQTCELRMMAMDGGEFWAHLTSTAVQGADGSLLSRVVISDITEQKRAEEDLVRLFAQKELILSSAAEGILGLDLQGNHTFVNPAAARMLGYEAEELLHRPSHGTWHHTKPDGSPYPREDCQIYAAYRDGTVHRTSTEVFWRKDGTSFCVEYASTPIFENNRVAGAVVTFNDITERRRAEETVRLAEQALRKSHEEFKELFDDAPVGYHEIDANGLIVRINNTELTMLAYSAQELRGQPVWKLMEPADQSRSVVLAKLAGTIEPDQPYERNFIRKDGTTFPVLVEDKILKRKDGSVAGIRSIVQDISERKQAEEALRVKHWAIESATNAIVSSDLEGNLNYVNPAFLKLWGYSSQAEVLGKPAVGFWQTGEKAAEVVEALRTRGGWSGELVAQRKNGAFFDVHVASSMVVNDAGQPVCMQASFADITDRKQAEDALRESEARYRQFFEDDLTGDFVSTVDGTLLSCNPAFARIYGFESVEHALKSTAYTCYANRESRDSFLDQLRRNKRLEYFEEQGRRQDGKPLHLISNIIGVFDENDQLVQIRGYVFDDTQRKRAEEALRQEQKLESIGTLAGGIAHDFNNLLSAMLGQTSLALGKLAPENIAVSHLIKATKAAEHAADLTRQLLAYSGKGRFLISVIDLNRLVNENLLMLETSVPKTAQLQFELGSPPPHIRGDVGQIQQVIMNLIINAGEAMELNPGSISVRTGRIELTKNDTEYWKYTTTPLAPGIYALLQVSDNGHGMKPDVLTRIFDPFFTTKFTGRGLGLAAVLGIIRGHHGGVCITSEEGKGARFDVVLPIVEPSTTDDVPGAKRYSSLNEKGKTILVIDDEPSVLELTKDILTEAKFIVLGALNPMKGIELYRQHQQNIAMVILDYSMPGMNGRHAFEELLKINKEVRVLLASGYTEEELDLAFGDVRPAGFLYKPYQPPLLLERVSGILSAKQQTAE